LIRPYISLVHCAFMERDATKKSKVAPGLTTGKTRGVGSARSSLTSGS
jgi:hypothetical protein